MIVTVTLNPAVDKTATLVTMAVGGLNRLTDVLTDAGGKGINVSKMIATLGGSSVATGFLGGNTGEFIRTALAAEGITTDFVSIGHTTRTNLKVLCTDSGITELNEPGNRVTAEELAALEETLLRYASPETLFVFAGSVPSGAASDTYARLIRLVRARGAMAFLDADGEAFRTAVDAQPSLIKPNSHELAQYFGVAEPQELPALLAMCQSLLARGIAYVVLSMGADGALFVSNSGALHAKGLSVQVLSTVGAGDSMVGALAYALDAKLPWADAAALAMAAGAGAVTTAGTRPPAKTVIDTLLPTVQLHELT